ncbi:MAG: uracil-DNA glycosylase [Planctomycetes bacterium]|nr:uracil-DNA glycosylase [Planctomycetota bacterium]
MPPVPPAPDATHDVSRGPPRRRATADELALLRGDGDVPPLPARPTDPAAALEAIAREVAACRLCPLCETRGETVPGEGDAHARIVFVGEGPGADEDRTGRPFVGRAGQLLDDIITKGMKRRREEVFICNVVKCRPPGNRVPLPTETGACSSYLQRQLEILQPAVICALGATAAQHLLATDLSMARLRRGNHSWRGIPVIPTYHPAYLLRNPEAKRPTWEDIQKVMEIANRP